MFIGTAFVKATSLDVSERAIQGAALIDVIRMANLVLDDDVINHARSAGVQ